MPATILVIDDDPVVRQVVDLALTQAGYTVASASTGESGVQALQHTRAALILLDVQMPGMSGISVLDALRRSARGGRTPVIMLTSRGDADTVRAALAGGASGYIVKPFKPVDLVRRVDAVLKPVAKSEPPKPKPAPQPPPAKPDGDKDSFMLD
jgi:DNA-binding response OmpR family regulator